MIKSLRECADQHFKKIGKAGRFGSLAGPFTCVMQDDLDGKGPYILHWDEATLGPVPTTADGFDLAHLRKYART